MINERTEFALRSMQEGINFTKLCRDYGISRKTGYKWRERFLQEGAHGMLDESKRPHTSPEQLSEEVILRINRLHERHRAWGPKKIQELYERAYREAPSLSSFKRVFERSGWVKKRRRRRDFDGGRISHASNAVESNDIWTVDFKGWWRTGDGSRCEPLTIRDEATRYLIEVRSMNTIRTDAVRAVFEQAFRRYGLPKAIRSDNGSPFAARSNVLGLSRLSAWWVVLGINLERGRPGKPQDNGAHERMHRDIQAELQCCAAQDPQAQQAAFDVWCKTFNEQRPHESLGMRMPAELYVKSPRAYHGTPDDVEYTGMISRRVRPDGVIQIHRQRIQLSTALAGWSVGLKFVKEDQYDVYFSNLRIGQLELTSAVFLGSASRPEEDSSHHQKNIS